MGIGLYSFICQGTSTRTSEGTFSVFELSYHLLLLVEPLKGRGIPVKCHDQGQQVSLPAYLHFLFYAERRAEKL